MDMNLHTHLFDKNTFLSASLFKMIVKYMTAYYDTFLQAQDTLDYLLHLKITF